MIVSRRDYTHDRLVAEISLFIFWLPERHGIHSSQEILIGVSVNDGQGSTRLLLGRIKQSEAYDGLAGVAHLGIG